MNENNDIKRRLDVSLFEKGLVRSRSAAQDHIDRGNVKVNGSIILKPSFLVSGTDDVSLLEAPRFVSRAGDKLAAAIDAWKVDVKDLVVVDIGSSTGGFTDCLLQRGSSKVIAVDVGTDQLDSKLRGDSRVEAHEGVDIRKFSLPSPADMAVIDVSFISLAHVLAKAFELVKDGGEVICLVKPQFEVGRELAQKRKGIIRDDAERTATLNEVKKKAKEVGFIVGKHIDSPIEGENGNREFLLHLKKVK